MELVARAIGKRYPGVTALDDVTLSFRSGEVHAVAGENGAGKSTLMKVLSGAVRPDSGTITIDGAPVDFRSPRDAQAAGIRMIHQELSLVSHLTVAENVMLGAEVARGGVINRHAQRARTSELLGRLGRPDINPDGQVAALPLAARQMVEIAKALNANARMLILDEPTGVLAHDDADRLLALMRSMRDADVSIVYVSHRMDEIARVADVISVLRDGRLVSTSPASEMTPAEVVRRMVGRDVLLSHPGESRGPSSDLLLRIEALTSGPVRDVSLDIHRGEILGMVGLVGAGRTEVARAIYGAAPITSGRMTLNGQPFAPRSPADAVAAGIALLPEDRKAQGLILDAAVRVNASLPSLGRVATNGIVSRRREIAEVAKWMEQLHVRARSPEQLVRLLSGGNQQKVIVARWLMSGARLLIFDEPTRGIDVGARAEIYTLMRSLADNGTSILMISSDLPEALGMSDRVVAMRSGRIVGTLARPDATPDRVASLILGAAAA